MPAIWNDMKSGATSAYNRLNQSYLGRSFIKGAGEQFGFNYAGIGTGNRYLGFINHRETVSAFQKQYGGSATSVRQMTKTAYQQKGIKGLGGLAGKYAMGSLGLAFTLHSAYTGYKEGGLLGAATSVGTNIALNTAISAGFGLPIAPIAGVAALGYGAYRLSEAGNQYRKNLQQLEFGGSFMNDAIGSTGAATSRQRAVMALQNTHLNGRMALGNEASVLHGISSYR